MPHSTISRFFPIAVILCAAPVLASTGQNQSVAAPAPTEQTTTQPATKVWTNENIASAGPAGDDSRPAAGTNTIPVSRPKSANVKGRNVKWYRDQITAQQARIPPLDAQIAELQSALGGKAAGDAKTSQRPRFAKIDQWPAELKDLQTRRQRSVDKIDALRDEARHNGVPPNALP